jgi:IstB-like ATP binding protein
VAHPARQSARTLDPGDVSFRPPARREPQTDSRVWGVGVHCQGGEHCPGRKNGCRQDGTSVGLLLKALENGYRCQFIRAQDLFDEMYASLADRSTRQLLKRLARLDVLLIDELGYLNLKPEQSNIFFKLMEERYRQHSTIITTNLVYDEWPNFLGARPMVEALLSRLRHYCHTVTIDGPSLRDLQG